MTRYTKIAAVLGVLLCGLLFVGQTPGALTVTAQQRLITSATDSRATSVHDETFPQRANIRCSL